ncbi:hypothetical protein AMAG_19154 [Allomyces macrogynus ATCC 38327]|uniref:Transmembrane protein n=1 Tax=Allomyces macrogynus (strain ATCC 38327) TaxID=578462 RepID=A0A0L0SPQ4_ALLM3|nr:hypothetical protein AMAG_19154 [Allomyces macrogynus ATCC 38327]|eukprot:KNE64365.1 hypothetical protein AMAG_19154 [Allomyces macrogynus ATCC 38327]
MRAPSRVADARRQGRRQRSRRTSRRVPRLGVVVRVGPCPDRRRHWPRIWMMRQVLRLSRAGFSLRRNSRPRVQSRGKGIFGVVLFLCRFVSRAWLPCQFWIVVIVLFPLSASAFLVF